MHRSVYRASYNYTPFMPVFGETKKKERYIRVWPDRARATTSTSRVGLICKSLIGTYEITSI